VSRPAAAGTGHRTDPGPAGPGAIACPATPRTGQIPRADRNSGKEQVINRSCHTGRILRLAGLVAGRAAVRAVRLGRPAVTTVLPAVRPLDQGAPPASPSPPAVSCSWHMRDEPPLWLVILVVVVAGWSAPNGVSAGMCP
jgi:hypothetical protein